VQSEGPGPVTPFQEEEEKVQVVDHQSRDLVGRQTQPNDTVIIDERDLNGFRKADSSELFMSSVK
jgi:hypothetical protein